MMDVLYEKSFLTKPDVAMKILAQNPEGFFQQLEGDYAWQMVQGILDFSEKAVFAPYNEVNAEIEQLQREYMAALMAAFPNKAFTRMPIVPCVLLMVKYKGITLEIRCNSIMLLI
ncbi:MAG: hypothetical protein R2795_18885 [Saprospiraceae bacterium]